MSAKTFINRAKYIGRSLVPLIGDRVDDAVTLFNDMKQSLESGYAADSTSHLTVFGYDAVLVYSGSMASKGDFVTLIKEVVNSVEDVTKPLPAMQDYANMCFTNGEQCICVVDGVSNLMDERIRRNLKQYYEGTVVSHYTVSNVVEKIQFIHAYAQEFGIPLQNITVVDNDVETLIAAKEAGMCAKSVAEIIATYELGVLDKCEESRS